MGRQIETTITDFTGGVTTEARTKDKRKARALKHFNILSSEDRLIPYRRFEADTFNSALGASVAANGVRIVKFLTYGTRQAGTMMFGLGTGTNAGGDVTDDTPRLYYRSVTDIFVHDNWLGDSATTGIVNENLFIEFRGIAYAARANEIIQWTLDVITPFGGSAFASSRSLTFVQIFQGLVHSAKSILYVPYMTLTGAFIATNVDGAWGGASSDTALTIYTHPSSDTGTGGKIDLCEKGNFIAVAFQPKFVGGNSYVYLWDGNAALADVSESISWGVENIELIEDIDGYLIGISTQGANSAANFSDSAKVLIKYWDGVRVNPLLELRCDDRTIQISQKQKVNNRMYFMMSCKISGAWHEGVWSIGRNKNGQFALALEYQLNNDTQATAVSLKGFKLVGDYMVISYVDNSTYTLKVTDDAATFSDTSIYESPIFNGGGAALKKDLLGITVMTEPLDDSPAAQVVVRYKKDNDSSWTTLLTHDTDAAISASAAGAQTSPAAFPKDYKEIQFRLESTASAVITGYSFREEVQDKRPY